MIKVMFVCLGNICRSPLAEAIFEHKLKEKELDSMISCDSSGTANWHVGDPPDPRTVDNAARNHVYISHIGRQFYSEDAQQYQYIIAMDKENLIQINKIIKDQPGEYKLFMMRDFDSNQSGEDLPDPYYGSKKDFQEVFELLDVSCENLVNYLVKAHRLR